MSSPAQSTVITVAELDEVREARDVIRHEAQVLQELSRRIDGTFSEAVALVRECTGTLIVTGMGKAGLIGRKIAATLSSTGTRAMFLHPAEAVHGDVGCVRSEDVVLALSNSGETEEICRLLPILTGIGAPVLAITAHATSTLGRNAAVTIELGPIREAGPMGLAPTASTTAMLAVGDALALVVSRTRGFTRQQFALFHPGGSLGQQLTAVQEIMRRDEQLRIASDSATVRSAISCHGNQNRRTGAVMLVDTAGRLTGVFTDSDLARLLEQRRDAMLDGPIEVVMTRTPKTIEPTANLAEAVELMSVHRISELPVVDADGKPIGLVDITDLIGAQSTG